MQCVAVCYSVLQPVLQCVAASVTVYAAYLDYHQSCLQPNIDRVAQNLGNTPKNFHFY